MRRRGRCSSCGLGWISGLSHGPGPHRVQPEDRGKGGEVEADCGEVGTIPRCCQHQVAAAGVTLKASIVLSMEGLSPKLRSLFDPLMVFDHGTLVPLDTFDTDIHITGFFLCFHLLHIHPSLIMVRSFEKHLYLNFTIRCKHSRVIVLYAATSSLYHHMHPCPPSLYPPIHPPYPNPSHFLTHPPFPYPPTHPPYAAVALLCE